MIDLKLHEILKNRKVLLLGGGPRELDLDLNEFFVVWINNHWLNNKALKGDAVYASGAEPPLDFYPKTLSYIAFAIDANYGGAWSKHAFDIGVHQFGYPFKRYMADGPYGAQHAWINRLWDECGTKPFSGMVAIDHLLSYPISELRVDGITFYYDKWNNRFPWKRGPHHVERQMEWLARKAKQDFRLKLSPFLREHCQFRPPLNPVFKATEVEVETDTIWAVESDESGVDVLNTRFPARP